MSYSRVCEVCGHSWKSRYGYIWILLCPKCRISGYHQPLNGKEVAHADHLVGVSKVIDKDGKVEGGNG